MVFFDLISLPPQISIDTEANGRITLAPDAAHQLWEADGLSVALLSDDARKRLRVDLRAPGAAVRRVHLRWSFPVPEGLRYLGDHVERGYGDLEWRGLVPERVMPWYFLAWTGETTHGYGVETGPGAICYWQTDSSGVSLTLDVSCGGRGVQLGDRALACATVITRRGEPDETPFQSARAFCKEMCPSPRLPAQPVYGGNDWYYAYGNNSADSIRRDAALIREHSPAGDNLPFMVIDDGWAPVRVSGPYDHGSPKFPDMAGLAAEMKAMSVRPGIWVRPLKRTAETAPASWRLPETHPLFAEATRDKGAYLDPSLPEVIDLVKKDIARCAHEWGYDLIKHDFSTYDIFGRWGFDMTAGKLTTGDWSFADRSRTTAEIILDLYQAIRDAAGEKTLIIGCNTIGHLGAGLFELQRTGDDTSGHEWDRTRKMGVNTLAFRMSQHETFFAADADCVGLTTNIPWHLNRQWLDLLARSGTALFVSASPDAVGPEQSAALKEAFALAAVPQVAGEPLDWLHTICPRRWRLGGETAMYDWFDL